MIKNTSPIKEKDKNGNYTGRILKRRFLGNPQSKIKIEQKELRAYIKGHSNFRYKYNSIGNPQWFKVRQEYYYS